MQLSKTKTFLPLSVPLLLGLAGASPASAFTIDLSTTFVPFANISHVGQPIHEEITRDAITNVTPSASQALIVNLQHGAQNPDIIHQFDSESHFDNCSVLLNVGFSNAFATITQRMESARQNAVGNPEFLAPHYTSYLDISADVVATLTALATDPECILQPACPTAQAAADAVLIMSFLPALATNPNPDPHRVTNPHSLFNYPPGTSASGLSGYLGPVQELYLEILGAVNDAVTGALGNHFDPIRLRDRTLEDVLGSSNSHVVQLKRLQNAIWAFHAHQDLGHAMHAAQDFFAHSDYVEVMAGVGVGQAMPPGTVIPLPTDFSQFNLAGVQTVMGAARFNLLESGEVLAIWLGEGDYSLGNAGIQNFFNPNTGIQIGGIDLLGLHIPATSISSVGQNPNPFPGFNHGHYLSSTALGLNKDCPSASPTDEPAHQNHLFARQAAVQMSSLLWTAFLQSIGERATPILLTCPPNLVVASAPGQCSATGVNLGAPSVSGGCQPPSVTNDAPAQLLKGTNLVHWTAADSCGNSNMCTQTIVVVDRQPPQITCSTNRVAAATSSSGARVDFPTPAASDNCPGVSVYCIPPSGSTFPIGTSTVLATAFDASDNRAKCGFTIHIKGAAEQTHDLIVLVGSFPLARGMENSLNSQLNSLLQALSAGNKAAASDFLQSFISHTNAQSGKGLTGSQAGRLVAAATQIQAVIK